MTSWLIGSDKGVYLQVHASPRAAANQIQGLHGDALKIRLKAPPVDGKANDTLIDFLAETLGIAKQNLTLVSGQTSRQKRLLIRELSLTAIKDKITSRNTSPPIP